MLNEVAIWTAPSLPVRADVTARRGDREEFTDADYVPVQTYPKSLKAATHPASMAIAVVPSAVAERAAGAGDARSGVELYVAIFNFRELPTNRLSVYA